MQTIHYDVVVVGGGPAGLAAALAARERQASVAMIERNGELGGILEQCIHAGFGLHHFREELTGPEYAERFIDQLTGKDIAVYLDTMVLKIDHGERGQTVQAINEKGTLILTAEAVVLAMGCRERTRGAIRIPGDRPAGVFTAGIAQRYVNLENMRPGNRAVILGSGDIGLIMARRFALEGIEVEGVYEIMPYPNGLYRNIINCLDDFGIPLHLSTTVTRINGKDRVQSVEVCEVDGARQPIPKTRRVIPCDTLLLSVGLIPENELSRKAGVAMDPVTGGPQVDDILQTSVPGIFACGNVLHVHDVVDYVTEEAFEAGRQAADYAAGARQKRDAALNLYAEAPVRYTVPAVVDGDAASIPVKFRVAEPIASGRTQVRCGDQVIFEEKKPHRYLPSNMEIITLPQEALAGCTGELKVGIVGDKTTTAKGEAR
ncbi:NAD(P)/FAD-dependent oxidoreductase [Pseudoramibacter faecis]|uniref:NAD(P)/FAD-dependent oxidoreductase n=1 Tax=Pseudoramibacter faecis TaxID=3108534 RepID=UPI002E798011|nr:FAD-dependent oxidoreductase [Pseudoramibacter sp. HA2172]